MHSVAFVNANGVFCHMARMHACVALLLSLLHLHFLLFCKLFLVTSAGFVNIMCYVVAFSGAVFHFS